MEETTINISLNDKRSKYISEAIGNKTCIKILNLLSTKEGLTVTEISNELNIPLNSVDYNIKKLVKSGLIESSSYWWSVKGKKMPAYKISNKKIVISPKKISSKIMLSVSLFIGGLVSLIVRFFTEKNIVREEIASPMLVRSLDVGEKLVTTPEALHVVPWQWFLIGIWSGIVLFFLFIYFAERRYKK